MAQGNRQEGAQQRQQPQQFTPNERLTLAERLTFVLGQLATRQQELEAVLPPDIPFARFHATVNQALRNNPDLLECTPVSLVNACVKSAYDGLRVDGKEAALVSHNVKVQEKGKPDRWEKRAQYFPMVFGLIQQILRGGMVIAIEADIIYANDNYRVIRGTAPAIEHEPLIVGDRGAPIGAYSVAVFPSGYRSTLFLRADEIEDVRLASKSGNKDGKPHGIWLRWWAQMWIKTVIRRHRKTLPVGRDIVDSEAADEFGLIDERAQAALPAGQTAPARPARPAALEHNQMGNGVPLDFDQPEGELIDGDAPRGEEKASPQQQKALDLPSDAAEWSMWESEIKGHVGKALNSEAVNLIWRDEAERMKAAPKNIRDALSSALTDRIAELATDGGGGSGTAGDSA